MSSFLMFFLPLFIPLLIAFGAFLYVLFAVKMITEVASNNDLQTWEKVLWSVGMVVLLPVSALGYFFVVHFQHHDVLAAMHLKHNA